MTVERVESACDECGLKLWDADNLEPGDMVCVCDDPDDGEADARVPLVSLASTVTAEKVTVKAVKLVACSRCGRGKKLRRTKTITEVLRPTDRPKSILGFMKIEAEDWTPQAAHPPCKCPYFTDAR